MKCDICKVNDAIILLQEVRGSERQELRLCMECAAEKGIPTPNQEDFNPKNIPISKILGMFSNKFNPQKNPTSVEDFILCDVCGTSLQDIKRYRTVGCPVCYTKFADDIKKVLGKNPEQVYSGTFPKHIADGCSLLQSRAKLQKELERYVAIEDFENAAIFRDKIKELDSKNE